MYFIYSPDAFLLKKTTDKIIKSLNTDNDAEIIELSLIDDSLQTLDEAVNTFSLFGNKKIVIVKESWFVTEAKVAITKDYSPEKIMKILENKNPDVKVVFTLNSDKFSKKLKIAKWIEEHATIEQVKALDEVTIRNYISQSFVRQNKQIDNGAVDYMLKNIPSDMQIISNEVSKMLHVSDHVTLKDVENNLTKYPEADVFELSNYFMANDIDKFLSMFNDYLVLNNDLIGLIALISANVAFTRNAVVLQNQGDSQSEIASKLGANPYRLKMALQSNKSNIENLNDKIKMLYNLQKNMISSKADVKIIPEYEFIKVMKG